MFWGLIMEPSKRYTQVVEKAFHVSMASLDLASADNSPVQVKLHYDDASYVLCTLNKANHLYQVPLDLNFQVGSKISFTCNGQGFVHLTGYLVLDEEFDLDDLEEEELEEEEEDEDIPKLVTGNAKRKLSPATNEKTSKRAKQEVSLNSSSNSKELNDGDDDSDEDEDESMLDDADSEEELVEQESDDEDEDDEEDDDDDEDDEDDDSDEEEIVQQSKSKKVKVEEKKNKQPQQKQPQQQQKKNQQDKKVVNGQATKEEKTNKQQKNNQEQKQQQKNNQEQKQQEQVQKKRTVEGGVQIEEIKVGNGNVAKPGKFVTVYYVGKLKNGKKFDSTTQGEGFKFRLGKGEVIKGWDVGLNGMKVGGKRKIVIPPGMGYGAKGSPPVIPGNSTLIFDVELRRVN